ncbi:MAG: sigma-70 family RNA polymerase sigma factor [Planctomycetes bacterium]|nr:sigma-70 family RNA polymerase sigma factor [Planctomycetota bacterium]
MSSDPDLDPAVVLRAQRGDHDAFAEVVRHFQGRIHALAYRLTYDAELSRDVTQDVFLRLHEQFQRYDPARPFTPWFMTLATNYALNARARARVRRTVSLSPPGEEAPGIDPADADALTGAEASQEAEARRVVRRAIQELPEKYAAVVVLHYLEGLGVKEIGERLDMPLGTVKIRLYRARNVLREKLERLEG